MSFLTTRRRRALAAGVLVLALGAAGVSTNLTGAWFTASSASTVTVTGALLSIGEIGKASDKTTIAVSDVYPMTDAQALANAVGVQARSEWITVRNTGTIPLDWSMQIVNPVGKAPLTAQQVAMFRFQLFTEAGVKLTEPLTLGSRPAAPVSGGELTSGTALAAGAQSKVEIRVWLDTAAGDEFQGTGASFDVVINAIQNGGPAPKALPAITLSAQKSGAVSGTTTALSWTNLASSLQAAGYTSAVTYTAERSTSADFANAETVYAGTATTATDLGGSTPATNRTATVVAGGESSNGFFAQIGSKVYRWGTFNRLDTGDVWHGSDAGNLVEVTGWSGAITKLSVGTDHACAVIQGGTLQCVGFDGYGQLGDGEPLSGTVTPITITDTNGVFTAPIVDVAAGYGFTCALDGSGNIGCWGRNSRGQLGVANGTAAGQLERSGVPVKIADPDKVFQTRRAVALATGIETVCAVKAPAASGAANTQGHDIACWGGNPFGQLGTAVAEGTNSVKPLDVVDKNNLLGGAVQISGGHGVFCALTDKYTTTNVACWGGGELGVLGNGVVERNAVPQQLVTTATGFRVLDVGSSQACAATATGLYCWGVNVSGQLGNGDITQTNVVYKPTLVKDDGNVFGGSSIVGIGLNGNSSCAVSANGALGCWGNAGQYQLGQGESAGTTPSPAKVAKPIGVKLDGSAIAGPDASSCQNSAVLLSGKCSLGPTTPYYYRVSYRIAGWDQGAVASSVVAR